MVFSTKYVFAVENSVGLMVGKEIGLIYTQQYNRLNISFDGGWLSGVAGGRVALNGGCRVFSMFGMADWIGFSKKNLVDIKLDFGLGVFGQYLDKKYQQSTLAKEMDYTVPFGVQFFGKIYFNVSPSWIFSLYVNAPIIIDDKNEKIKKERDSWKYSLYLIQLAVQYKINFTRQEKTDKVLD
jgi:hypothetical protein